MLNFKGSVLTEKGVLKPAVREEVRKDLGITLSLRNGSAVELENMGGGVYYGQIGQDINGVVIYGKVNLAITVNEYHEPVAKEKVAKETEVISFE